MPTDLAIKKFLWSDYFHDSIMTNIGFANAFKGSVSAQNILKITIQSDRDCAEFCRHHHKKLWESVHNERFTYILYFSGVEYFQQECNIASMVYLNGRFKSTQKIKQILAENTSAHYHFRIQTTGGFIDIIFKNFKVRKKIGRVNYSVDGYAFTPSTNTVSPKDKKQMDEIFHGAIDEWDCLAALEKLDVSKDPDLLKYARFCLNVSDQELEDVKRYSAYLLGKVGEKSDLQAIEELYFKTQNLLQKRHLQDAIEMLRAKA